MAFKLHRANYIKMTIENVLYLYLLLISSSDVRNCPASLFFNALFVIMSQEAEQASKSSLVNDTLEHKQTPLKNPKHVPSSIIISVHFNSLLDRYI